MTRTLPAHILCASFLETLVHPLYDLTASKKSANLSINADLLQKAKALDINLSATLEAALAAEVKRRRAVLLTPMLAGISKKELGAEAGSLREKSLEIISALDVLSSGV